MVDGQRSSRESLRALSARLRPSDGDSGGWGDISSDPVAGGSGGSEEADGWGAPMPGASSGVDGTRPPSQGAGGWGFDDAAAGGLDARGSAAHGSTRAIPAAVVRPMVPGVSRATWFAIAAVVIGGLGIGIGLHLLLAGIDIVGWMLEGAALFSRVGVAAVIALAVIALAGLVLAVVALVRSRRRGWAAAALIAAIILPPASGAIGVLTGVTAFKENTISDVRLYASQLSPERVESVYEAFEEHGITLPAEDEVLSILEESHGALDDGDEGEDSDSSSSADTTDDDHEEGEG